MNVKLQLIDLIAKQQVFHQLRTVEQLGYTASLQLRLNSIYILISYTEVSCDDYWQCLHPFHRSDSGVYGLEFTVQSTSKVHSSTHFLLFISNATILCSFALSIYQSWQSPKHIDSRVQAFLKMFENKMHEMKDDDFKVRFGYLLD